MGQLGRSGGSLGAMLGRVGAMLGRLGGHLGAILGHLERSGSSLGAMLGRLGAMLGENVKNHRKKTQIFEGFQSKIYCFWLISGRPGPEDCQKHLKNQCFLRISGDGRWFGPRVRGRGRSFPGTCPRARSLSIKEGIWAYEENKRYTIWHAGPPVAWATGGGGSRTPAAIHRRPLPLWEAHCGSPLRGSIGGSRLGPDEARPERAKQCSPSVRTRMGREGFP